LKDENAGLRLLHFMDLLCKSIGNPLNRVFHEQTVHWTVCFPFLIFMQAKNSLSAESDQLFEKSWIKNF